MLRSPVLAISQRTRFLAQSVRYLQTSQTSIHKKVFKTEEPEKNQSSTVKSAVQFMTHPETQAHMTQLLADGLHHTVKYSSRPRQIQIYLDDQETQFIGKEGCGPSSFISGVIFKRIFPDATVSILCSGYKDPLGNDMLAHVCNQIEFSNNGKPQPFIADSTWRQFAFQSRSSISPAQKTYLFDHPVVLFLPENKLLNHLKAIYTSIVTETHFDHVVALNWSRKDNSVSAQVTNQLTLLHEALNEPDSIKSSRIIPKLACDYMRHLYFFFKTQDVEEKLESLKKVYESCKVTN